MLKTSKECFKTIGLLDWYEKHYDFIEEGADNENKSLSSPAPQRRKRRKMGANAVL